MAARNFCLKNGPGKADLIFEKDDFASWVNLPDWSENLGMKGIGGGNSFFLFRPFGAMVLILAIQNCSRSILNNNSFIGIRPPVVFLGTTSTGVMDKESKPPQRLLLKCTATGVCFNKFMSERCWTNLSWTELFV